MIFLALNWFSGSDALPLRQVSRHLPVQRPANFKPEPAPFRVTAAPGNDGGFPRAVGSPEAMRGKEAECGIERCAPVPCRTVPRFGIVIHRAQMPAPYRARQARGNDTVTRGKSQHVQLLLHSGHPTLPAALYGQSIRAAR